MIFRQNYSSSVAIESENAGVIGGLAGKLYGILTAVTGIHTPGSHSYTTMKAPVRGLSGLSTGYY